MFPPGQQPQSSVQVQKYMERLEADQKIGSVPGQSPMPAIPIRYQVAIEEKLRIEQRMKNGAGWLTAIGALSLINSLMVLINVNWTFFLGLGITQVIDGFTLGMAKSPATFGNPTVWRTIAMVLNVTISAFYIALGKWAQNRGQWPFYIGMAFYALDGLVFIWAKDYLALAFHGWALWMVFNGLKASRQLKALEKAAVDSIQSVGPAEKIPW